MKSFILFFIHFSFKVFNCSHWDRFKKKKKFVLVNVTQTLDPPPLCLLLVRKGECSTTLARHDGQVFYT